MAPVSYWARVSVVVLLVVVGFGLLWLLRSVALVLVASLVLAIGLQPSIRWLENRGLRRGWALAAILLAGLILMIGLGSSWFPFWSTRSRRSSRSFPLLSNDFRRRQGWWVRFPSR